MIIEFIGVGLGLFCISLTLSLSLEDPNMLLIVYPLMIVFTGLLLDRCVDEIIVTHKG